MLIWRSFRVNYKFIFELDPRNHLEFYDFLQVIFAFNVDSRTDVYLFCISCLFQLGISIYTTSLAVTNLPGYCARDLLASLPDSIFLSQKMVFDYSI